MPTSQCKIALSLGRWIARQEERRCVGDDWPRWPLKECFHQVLWERGGVAGGRACKVFACIDILVLIVDPFEAFVTPRCLVRRCLVPHVWTHGAVLLLAPLARLAQPNHRHPRITCLVHARDHAHEHRVWIIGCRDEDGHRLVHHQNGDDGLQDERLRCKLGLIDDEQTLIETTDAL